MKYSELLAGFARLRKNTTLDRERIKALQERKLRILLQYAWEHSDYYRRSFAEAGISAERISTLPLTAFPVMDKQALLQNFDALVTEPDLTQEELRRFDMDGQPDRRPYLGKYHVVHSSGSTGKPGYFVYDEAAWQKMLLGIIRGALWDMTMPQVLKLLLKKPRILYIAATDGRYGGAMAVGDGIDGIGASQMFLDIKTPLPKWVDAVRSFRPSLVIGYPSAIKILAELAAEGKAAVKLERLISCGEPLAPNQRALFERTFCCPVINIYGASESLALGVETGKEDGMILFDDLNVIEVVDGEMYLTCLYNFVQPLIRYKISDKLTLREGEAGFTKADILLGRNEDLLWFEDGTGNKDFLHPLAVEGFCLEGLHDYQFRQTARDSFEMLAEVPEEEKREAIGAEMRRQMRAILQEKHLGYVGFAVRFVDTILPDQQTGKKRLVIAECY